MSSLHEGDEEAAELEEEEERKLQEMEEDLKQQKEAQLKSGASEQEIQAALAKLQQQHEAKRKVLTVLVKCIVSFTAMRVTNLHNI